jgi:tRNA nucleotidyltransferase (CCA-adding enzyme)
MSNLINDVDKTYGLSQVVIYEQQCFSLKDLAVNGNDILSCYVPEGPIVGHVLKYLLDKVINGELENDRDTLMEEAEFYIAEGRHYQFAGCGRRRNQKTEA